MMGALLDVSVIGWERGRMGASLDVSVTGWERGWMGALLDVSGSLDVNVIGRERCWMLVGWWSGGETIIEWWFDGGLIKITRVKEKLLSKDHSPLHHMYSHETRGRG